MSAKLQRLSNRHLLDRFLSKQNLGVEQKHEDDGNLNCALNSDSVSYAALRNIPKEMHSKELRRYFSSFVENAKFSCFHYRHRPELQASSQDELASSSTTNCCIISFYTLEDRNEFVKEFHGRHWMNKDGIEIPRRCFIDRILIRKDGEACSSLSMADSDLKTMLELRPPAVMPKGNVGTPSDFFLEQIRLCKLPSSIISKLGIQTSRRKRKFDAVPFAYDSTASTTRKTLNDVPDDSLRRDKTASFLKHRIQSIRDKAVPDDPTEKIYRERANDNDDDDDKDDDQCEEWERHEALHEDVTEQDRTKPKKYEEEMEVVWEKGGPGLVWYTDKNYWDEREKGTDCDWAWADDWDVDFSVYYEGKSAGELDARHAVEIREDEELRTGKINHSVFTRKSDQSKQTRTRRRSLSETVSALPVNGIGGKLLTKMGWAPGTGLGRRCQGKVVPVAIQVEEEGQAGYEHKGFGYRGDKLQRHFSKPPMRHAIASAFDTSLDRGNSHKTFDESPATDQLLLRRAEPTKMKYRNK